jgi:xanthine dehydrogenase large subunit
MNAPQIGVMNPALQAQGQSHAHESAWAQVRGKAQYVDDVPELQGTLYAAVVKSPSAHGELISIDQAALLQEPGVHAVLTHEDIPGSLILATFAHDEPILARDRVEHVGQAIAIVVASSVNQARHAAARAKVVIKPLPAILDIDTALAQKSFVLPPVHVRRGDAQAAIEQAPHRLDSRFTVGGQEHFYLEGQVAYAMPIEDGMKVLSSTQHPGEVQHWVAHALGISNAQVEVQCRRMGGGFGGKETQAGHLAVWASLAARLTGKPVKLRLDRDDDFEITGKRHNFAFEYTVGFDDQGQILGLQMMQAAQCGFSADLSGPVADRAVFHTDNAYWLPHVSISSFRCKTHTQSNTAFRGFGGPQGMVAIETVIEDIARYLGCDPLEIRKRNFYGVDERNITHYGMTIEDNVAPALVDELARTSRYAERRAQVRDFNDRHPTLKRGLSLTPVKFGISFTATQFNQAGALVHVFTDGSVLVNHGGTEMGQGLHTKVLQIVADELGVPFTTVRISASATDKVANASATAASAGTDLNGRAAQYAARQIRTNLLQFIAGLDQCDPGQVSISQGVVTSPRTTRSFTEAVQSAYQARIQLWSDGFYATPKIHYDKATLTGRPFYYFAYGAACVEVVIDTLTGESRVLAIDILHDVGQSINPAIDIGQIEGAFVQGMGWLTTEELVWTAQGRLSTHAPSTYKIPATGDIPQHFRVDLWPQANRQDNVYGSKAVGEPPFMLAIAVLMAMRDAVGQVAPQNRSPVPLSGPATAPAVLAAIQGLEALLIKQVP